MHLPARPRLRPLQLLHRPQYPLPRRVAAHVASLKHRVRPHGGTERRVLAVALYEQVGGSVLCTSQLYERKPRKTEAFLGSNTMDRGSTVALRPYFELSLSHQTWERICELGRQATLYGVFHGENELRPDRPHDRRRIESGPASAGPVRSPA